MRPFSRHIANEKHVDLVMFDICNFCFNLLDGFMRG